MPEPLFCVPHDDPAHLVGRDEVLREVHKRLTGDGGPTLVTALQGTGGIGKTQLAARYCWQYRPNWPAGILWLSMADPARVLGDLAQLAERQGIAGDSDRAKANGILGRIAGRQDALLVLDNLEDPTLLDRDLAGLVQARPRGLGCRLLITSRRPELPGCRALRLDFLPEPVARTLLLREAGRVEPNATAEADALRELLVMLGGLPLALVMTGRLLERDQDLTFVRLVDALRRHGAVNVLSEHSTIPPDYHEKIGRSFGALLVEAWDALPADRLMLRDILCSLSCLTENAFVPHTVLPLIIETRSDNRFGLEPNSLDVALRWLVNAQMLERNQVHEVRLHPLIHRFSRERTDAPLRTAVCGRILKGLRDPKHYGAATLPDLLRFAIDLDAVRGISGSGDEVTVALQLLTRMLSSEAYNLRRTATKEGGFSVVAQLAHAAALHGLAELHAAAEEDMGRRHEVHLAVRWIATISSSVARHRLHGHEAGVLGCVISEDGRTGMSASEDCTIFVWHLERGEMTTRLRGHEGRVRRCALSADGKTGLSASDDRTLIVWDVAQGEARYRLREHNDWIYDCAISADGRTGISACDDGTLIVWDLQNGEPRHLLRGHTRAVFGCAISADGRTGLSASEDRTLIAWDLVRGEKRNLLIGHKAWVYSCAISADGRTGLSASADHTLRVWNLKQGECRDILVGHNDVVRSCAISTDGRVGLSASEDRTLIVWDLASGKPSDRLYGHEAGVTGCSLSADGRTGLSASSERTLIVWDVGQDKLRKPLEAHTATVRSSAISVGGRVGFSASDDESLIVWDLKRGILRHRLRAHANAVLGCAVSGDGRIGLSASWDQTLIIWDLADGMRRKRLFGHDDGVSACALSVDGQIGISASLDQSLIVWNIQRGVPIQRLWGHNGPINSCALSANGKTALSASHDHTLFVWDLAHQIDHRLQISDGAVVDCALTGDGKIGLSASDDGTLATWDIQRREIRHLASVKGARVLSCAISPDGRFSIAALDNRTLIVWDVASNVELHRLALDAVPHGVAVCSQPPLAIVGDARGNVTLFELVLP